MLPSYPALPGQSVQLWESIRSGIKGLLWFSVSAVQFRSPSLTTLQSGCPQTRHQWHHEVRRNRITTTCFQTVRREWRLSVSVVFYNNRIWKIMIWNTTSMLLIKNLLDLFFLQVHPGGLARGGDHYEGFLQPYAACDSGLCRPLLGSTLCPKGSAPVTWNCLHGSLYTVRIHKYTILCMFHSILVSVGNLLLSLSWLDWRRLLLFVYNYLWSIKCISLFYLFISAAIWVKKSWPYVKLSGLQTTRINMKTWFVWWGRLCLCWRERSEWVHPIFKADIP